MTKMEEDTLSLLCNKEVLHLLELPAGKAKESDRDETIIVWQTEDETDSANYTAIFNVSEHECNVTLSRYVRENSKQTKELWTGQNIRPSEKRTIPSHGCLLLRQQKN